MHGRAVLFAKVLTAIAAIWLLAGCERPRIKSYESIESATLTNPPRDFRAEPLDPYSWGGIAMATGGRDPRTTYGAMAPGQDESVDEGYLPTSGQLPLKHPDDTAGLYLISDPRHQDKGAQFPGSSYIGNEAPGHAVA